MTQAQDVEGARDDDLPPPPGSSGNDLVGHDDEYNLEMIENSGPETSHHAVVPDPNNSSKGPAPMRNLYTAALSYNGYTITDGALRLIVLLHAADLGFNAIEIAFMFSLYEVRERLQIFLPTVRWLPTCSSGAWICGYIEERIIRRHLRKADRRLQSSTKIDFSVNNSKSIYI